MLIMAAVLQSSTIVYKIFVKTCFKYLACINKNEYICMCVFHSIRLR